ncbi:hypothetical protein QOM21_28100 [Streptomyces sp. Pv4-95]|uniref:hypothetical protein n=1 Tax=Streptomyces sp. Pv4-95 TaxID=3049543 RepID=UPI00389197FF
MPAYQLAQAVSEQLRMGRVLPLGGPSDGAWITERAAADALRAAVGSPAGARWGTPRLSLADPGSAPHPEVPAPPSALPPGPLRIEADFAAYADRPLTAVAELLRAALVDAAERELGLVVSAVDLRADDILEADDTERTDRAAPARTSGAPVTPQKARSGATQDGPEGIAAVARAVPGVARLAPVLGTRPVRLADGHAFVQLTTVAGHRALEVARAVRVAVTAAAPAARTVAVLVTAVEGNFSGGARPVG